MDHKVLGLNAQVAKSSERSVDAVLEPAIRQKFARIREAYNELRLDMLGGYSVVFRAYNEGVAYRVETSFPQAEVKVYGEEATFRFAGDYQVYFPQEDMPEELKSPLLIPMSKSIRGCGSEDQGAMF